MTNFITTGWGGGGVWLQLERNHYAEKSQTCSPIAKFYVS